MCETTVINASCGEHNFLPRTVKQYHPMNAVACTDAVASPACESTLLGARQDGLYRESCECGPRSYQSIPFYLSRIDYVVLMDVAFSRI